MLHPFWKVFGLCVEKKATQKNQYDGHNLKWFYLDLDEPQTYLLFLINLN